MSIHKFSPLIWDVDGTMVDTTDLIVAALNFVYRKHFQRSLPEEECRALIGIPLAKQIRIFGELESFGVQEEAITADFIGYYETHRDRERVLEEVTAILIEGKRRAIPTALVTSKNREELSNTLPRLGIAPYVDLAITADHVTRPKPAPEGILKVLQHFEISSDQYAHAVYIGDTLHDMEAAKAANINAIGVTWGAAGRDRLATAAPNYLCTTPTELRALLF